MEDEPPTRPVDVDTGFGLWVAALSTLVIGQAVDTALTPRGPAAYVVYAFIGLLLVLVCALVVTFLLLMRNGHRFARTALTGGGVATIAYVGSSLFTVDRDTLSAVTFAVTGIFGSVLIAGGVFLLHRKDSHAYFTR
ncbi:MAG: hypothetical protein QOH57_4319 [Mycobacterium sp.]|jgi:hypothetical protein|nr:hypothetical protein [Mycobacterium sp.]